MATRRFIGAADEIGDEGDAARLAARLNLGGDVHTVLRRQHVTSHVRDNVSESSSVVRKSGVRKVTTRVVRQTTTITRGDQRTVTEKLTHRFDDEQRRDAASVGHGACVRVRVRVPAIGYRATSERSFHNSKVRRAPVLVLGIATPTPTLPTAAFRSAL